MLNIIKRDLKLIIRDKGGLFFIIVFPTLLVFILGNMLQSLDNADEGIDPIRMAYVVETTDPFATEAIKSFTTALNENSMLELYETKDAAASQNMVNSGEIAALVRFTQPFSVELYEGFNSIQNRAIDSIFRGFTRQAGSLGVLAQTAPEKLMDAANATATELVKQKDFGLNRTMLDYYAVVMCVMIAFMGSSINGASMIYDGKRDGTIRRMLVTPKNRVSMYIQNLFGAMPQSLLQVGVIMLASVFLLGAHYANNFGDNLLLFALLVLCSLCVNAIGLLVGMAVNLNPMFFIMPILWLLMFFSGTFSKEIFIDGISNYSPVWLIQNAAFDLTIFGRGEKCLVAMLVCGIILVVATTIGALLFRRKGLSVK